MGQPVVHFEVVGKDGAKLQSYYSELFGWKIDTNNPMNYGIVRGQDNPAPENVGTIGGGVGQGPDGYEGHVTFYVEVPDIEDALARAESLGAGGKELSFNNLVDADAALDAVLDAYDALGRAHIERPAAPRGAHA